MNASWNELAGVVLAPMRPRLRQCHARAAAHAVTERARATEHTARLQNCQQRIEAARALVFEAGNGVVDTQMTTLEREWRELARGARSVEARSLELWSEVAPSRWAGTLRWVCTHDVETEAALAVALASDPEGVERAEQCAWDLVAALAPWGVQAPRSLEWRLLDAAAGEVVVPWLTAILQATTEALGTGYGSEALFARAEAKAAAVRVAAADSPLCAVLAQAAHADFCWNACVAESRLAPSGASFAALPNPVAALGALWRTGYAVLSIDERGVVLGAVAAST